MRLNYKITTALAICLGLTACDNAGNSSEVNHEEVNKIVEEFIMNNPKVIIQSIEDMQRKEMEEQEKMAQSAVKDNLEELYNDPDSPVLGNPNGTKVVVEFFDYNCGFCKSAFPTIVEVIEKHDDVKVVMKEFPILGPSSEIASRAALLVHLKQPEKYYEYHRMLMAHNGQKDLNIIKEAASKVGITGIDFENEMTSDKITQILLKNRDLANKLNIRGTPAFIANGTLIPGAVDYNALKAELEKDLQAADETTEEKAVEDTETAK